MNLRSVEIRELRFPFRFRYGHARAHHRGVESLLCIVRDREGREGFGEAVPRSYVTGESTGSVRHDIAESVHRVLDPSTTFEAFRERLAKVEELEAGPVSGCAWCGLETALTDLAARQRDCSVARLLGAETGGELLYTASIGIGSRLKLMPLLLLYKFFGFRRFKVKVGNADDLDRVRLIHSVFGSDVPLFADANAAWDKESAAIRIEALAALGIWAVEEPLRIAAEAPVLPNGRLDREALLTDEHLQDNAWLQARSPVPLIADESLISLAGAQRIIDQKAFEIFNIRLSKCGGYRRSSQFADLARAAGLSFSLGAMVGESPVLATAGAIWGASEPEHLYIQGHSHRVLYGASFAEGCPRLRRGGRLSVPDQPGTGLTLDREVLERVTVNKQTIEL